MKSQLRLLFSSLALFAFLLPTSSFAQSPTPPSYNGNRLEVTSIKLVKKKDQSIKIEFNLVNSGRNRIRLGSPERVPSDLIIEFDESLQANDISKFSASIIEALKAEDIAIRPGQLMMQNKLKVNYNAALQNTTPLEEDVHQEVAPTEVVDNQVITPDENINNEIIEEQVDKEKTEEVVQEIVEEPIERPIPTSEIKPQKTDSTASESIPTKVANLEKKDTPEENKTEKVADILTKLTPTKTEIIPNENADTLEIIDLETVVEEEEVGAFESRKSCPDLVMEKTNIIKQNKNFVLIEYTIKNTGKGPAALFGETIKEEDNVSIRAHLSRSKKLTRGSIPLNGVFITKGVKNKTGILEANESMTARMKIDIRKMTQFTPILVLTLDAFQTIHECDELNNVSFISLSESSKPATKNSDEKAPEGERVSNLEDSDNK